jgi:hypothetical protein
VNVLTLIGAAVSCREFCDLLFDDPARAAALLGFTLSRQEFELLKEAFTSKARKEMCDHLESLRMMLCKKSPCPFAPYLPGHEQACAAD